MKLLLSSFVIAATFAFWIASEYKRSCIGEILEAKECGEASSETEAAN